MKINHLSRLKKFVLLMAAALHDEAYQVAIWKGLEEKMNTKL
ncbi:hypothetical protein [Longitalea luteola]|nr:hypothetical protein [Longitalea luteola]